MDIESKIDKAIVNIQVPLRKMKKQSLDNAVKLLLAYKKSLSDAPAPVDSAAAEEAPNVIDTDLDVKDDDYSKMLGETMDNKKEPAAAKEIDTENAYIAVLDKKTNTHYVYKEIMEEYDKSESIAVLDKSTQIDDLPNKCAVWGDLAKLEMEYAQVGMIAKTAGVFNETGKEIRKIKDGKIYFFGSFGVGHNVEKFELATKILIPNEIEELI